MSLQTTLFSDFYSDSLLRAVAQQLRGGARWLDLRNRVVAQKKAQRELCLEDDDLFCCGDCCAAQQCCIICGRETSAAVRECPRPVMLTNGDISDLLCLDTAAGLVWAGSAGAAGRSWPGSTPMVYTCAT